MALYLFSAFLVVTAYILSQIYFHKGPPLTNTESVIYYDPSKIYMPSSLFDIQAIISSARKNGKNVRPLGSGHSWNEMPVADDIFISLYNYRGLVSVNTKKKQIIVRGGTRLWEINEIAHEHNLALTILPSISNQTIGGALATGTHGSGVDYGILMTFVVELELVDGRGKVHSLTAETDPNLFYAAGVSLGLLGIITEVTLQCENSFNLIEIRQSYKLAHCLENIVSLATGAEYVKFWIEINSRSCTVYSANKTIEQPRDLIPQPFTDIKIYFYELLQTIWSLLPFTANPGINLLFSLLDTFPFYNRVDHSWNVLNIPHRIDKFHRESEVSVPFEDCASAISDLVQLKETLSIPLNHVIEVRFVERDLFWLSNDYEQDSCHITLLLYYPSDELFYLYTHSYYKLLSKFGGRMHWGKEFFMSLEEVKHLYPKLDDFLHIRKVLDPDGIFLNKFLKNLFNL